MIKILVLVISLALLYFGINIALAAAPMFELVDVLKYIIGISMEFVGLLLLMAIIYH